MAVISFEQWYMEGNGLPKKLYKPQHDSHDLESPLRDAWTACLACGYRIDESKVDKAYEITLREEATARVISFLEYSGNATAGGTVKVTSPKTTVTTQSPKQTVTTVNPKQTTTTTTPKTTVTTTTPSQTVTTTTPKQTVTLTESRGQVTTTTAEANGYLNLSDLGSAINQTAPGRYTQQEVINQPGENTTTETTFDGDTKTVTQQDGKQTVTTENDRDGIIEVEFDRDATVTTEQSGDSTTETTAGTGTAAAVEAAKIGYRLAVEYLTERCRLFCLLARG